MFQTFVPPSPVGVQAVGERRHFSPRPLATSNGRYLRVSLTVYSSTHIHTTLTSAASISLRCLVS